MKFEIYKNYGVLAREKREIYTYGGEHPQATCSDKITVELPENKFFSLYENFMGDLMVETADGHGWYNEKEIISDQDILMTEKRSRRTEERRIRLELVGKYQLRIELILKCCSCKNRVGYKNTLLDFLYHKYR